jgi:hypothetical protein
MAKTSAEFEREFIDSVQSITGKTIDEWVTISRSEKLSGQKELTNFFKETHGLNHLQASLLAGICLNNGQPVYQNENALLDSQFLKAPEMRLIHEKLSQKVLAAFPDTKLIVKKTYLSYTATREFAAVNVKADGLRLGLDLGETQYTERLQKSKLSGPMPRFTHMVLLSQEMHIDTELMQWIKASYQRSHHK